MAGRVDKTGSGPGRTGASSVTRSPDRSLADRSTSFTGPTGQIMDTRRVEPISGSDPMNAALQPMTNSRNAPTTSSLPIGRVEDSEPLREYQFLLEAPSRQSPRQCLSGFTSS
jgi:hypothetical protein